jgi:hypothetical protein
MYISFLKGFMEMGKMQNRSHEGGDHGSDGRDISRLHHDPGRQYSLGSVNHRSHILFHYNRVFVFDGTFPRTCQEVGEDTPKEKKRK